MATDRLAELLRSRSDFSDEEIAGMSENDAWRWIHANECISASADNESHKLDYG